MDKNQMLQQLRNNENPAFNDTWKEFFLNVDMVQCITEEIDHDIANGILAAGTNWNGDGWNSTSASKTLFDITGVPLVAGDFSVYRDAFLYSLAIHWDVEIPSVTLADRSAEAAFYLAQAYSCNEEIEEDSDMHAGIKHSAGARHAEKGQSAEDDSLPWDEITVALPQVFRTIWNRSQSPEGKLELKPILEKWPAFGDLPRKAPHNNYRSQKNSLVDRNVRTWQQTLLHCLRLHAHVHQALQAKNVPEHEVLLLQAWQLQAELYNKMSDYRKEQSIPGSTEMGEDSNALFQKDDITNFKMADNINKVTGRSRGKGYAAHDHVRRKRHRFRRFPRFGQWRRNFKGSSKGATSSFSSGPRWSWKGGKGRRPYQSTSHGGKGKGASPMAGPKNCPTTVSPQAEVNVVEAKSAWSADEDYKRRYPSSGLSLYRLHLETPRKTKNPRRFFSCPATFQGVHGNRGIGGSSPRRLSFNKVHHPMVHHFETRRDVSKASPNLRLQGAKHALHRKKIYLRKLVTNFPLSPERTLRRKNRPKACLFSPQSTRRPPTLFEVGSRGKSFPISRGLFRPKYFTRTLDGLNESSRKRMEKKGNPLLCLLRRYFTSGINKESFGKSPKNCAVVSRRIGFNHKPEKICFIPQSKSRPFRFSDRPSNWKITSTPRKVTHSAQGTRQTFDTQGHVPPQNEFNPRGHKKFFTGYPMPEGLHRRTSQLCVSASNLRVGGPTTYTGIRAKSGSGIKRSVIKLGGAPLSGSGNLPRDPTPVRRVEHRLGGFKHPNPGDSAGILERPARSTYKFKRINSGHKNSAGFSEGWGQGYPASGQSGFLLLPVKTGRPKTTFQRTFTQVPTLAARTQHSTKSSVGTHNGNGRGQHLALVVRQGGLHIEPPPLPLFEKHHKTFRTTQHRLLRQPRKLQVEKFYKPLAAFGSSGCGRIDLLTGGDATSLQQPPMEPHPPLVTKIKTKPAHYLPHRGPLLGFRSVVAPTSEIARTANAVFSDTPLLRDVHQLPPNTHACAKMAPTLSYTLRQVLQSRQISPKDIQNFLDQHPSIKRYDQAFRVFTALLKNQGIDPLNATVPEVAAKLATFAQYSSAQARNAYSAYCLIPGWESIRFSPLL